MLGSNPRPLQLVHWQSDALTTRLDLIRLFFGFKILKFFDADPGSWDGKNTDISIHQNGSGTFPALHEKPQAMPCLRSSNRNKIFFTIFALLDPGGSSKQNQCGFEQIINAASNGRGHVQYPVPGLDSSLASCSIVVFCKGREIVNKWDMSAIYCWCFKASHQNWYKRITLKTRRIGINLNNNNDGYNRPRGNRIDRNASGEINKELEVKQKIKLKFWLMFNTQGAVSIDKNNMLEGG
jgi:hypothetical protein